MEPTPLMPPLIEHLLNVSNPEITVLGGSEGRIHSAHRAPTPFDVSRHLLGGIKLGLRLRPGASTEYLALDLDYHKEPLEKEIRTAIGETIMRIFQSRALVDVTPRGIRVWFRLGQPVTEPDIVRNGNVLLDHLQKEWPAEFPEPDNLQEGREIYPQTGHAVFLPYYPEHPMILPTPTDGSFKPPEWAPPPAIRVALPEAPEETPVEVKPTTYARIEDIPLPVAYLRYRPDESFQLPVSVKEPMKVRCYLPGHEDLEPSLNLYVGTGRYYCFGCHRHGDVIGFLAEIHHCDRPEARKQLLEDFSVQGKTFDIHYFGDPKLEPEIVPPPTWIAGLLHHGYIIASGPWKKSLKTFLCMAMTLHIQTGKKFLNREVRKGKCLWIQADMTEADFLEYARKLRSGMDLPPAAVPYIYEPTDISKPDDQEAIEKIIRDMGIEIVFIDSLRAASTVEENDSSAVRSLTRDWMGNRLRDTLGLTIVVLHHSAKFNSGARGSGEFEAAADSMLRFYPYTGVQGKEHPLYVMVEGDGRHPRFSFTYRLEDHKEGLRLRELNRQERGQVRAEAHKEIAHVVYQVLVKAGPEGIESRKVLMEQLRDEGLTFRNHECDSILRRAMETYPQIETFKGPRHSKGLRLRLPTSPNPREEQGEQEPKKS